MPLDLILPLLVIALLLNAGLVAVAVRQLVREGPPDRRAATVAARPSGQRRAAAVGASATTRQPIPVATMAEGAKHASGTLASEAPTDAPDAPPDAPDAPTDVPDAPPGSAPGRRRPPARPRRFTLPPVTEDRERADRAIEFFLSGGRAEPPARPHPRPAPVQRRGDRRATTDPRTASVAILTIAGFRTLAAGDAPDRAAAVSDAVEETLRRTARTEDHVVALGDGRYRILLVGSTEPAANAYLERVRTACGPWLSVAGAPLDLVTASAEAGADGDLSQALRLAERRLGKASGGTDLETEAEG